MRKELLKSILFFLKGHYRKAIALFELGRLQEAVASFKIASSLDPTNEEIKKRYEEALHLWKKDQVNFLFFKKTK